MVNKEIFYILKENISVGHIVSKCRIRGLENLLIFRRIKYYRIMCVGLYLFE